MTSTQLQPTAPAFVPQDSDHSGESATSSSRLPAEYTEFVSGDVSHETTGESDLAMSAEPDYEAAEAYFSTVAANMDAFMSSHQHLLIPQPAPHASEIDVRSYSQPIRAVLAQGPLLTIYIGQSAIAQLPRALFLATSTKPELFNYSYATVMLPPHIEPNAVAELVNYLNGMVASFEEFPRLEVKGMTIYGMLSTTIAADALGMRKYVEHVYRKVEAIFRRHLPTYADLDAISHYAHQHERLLKIVAQNLAVRVWEKEIPDAETFHAYLAGNLALSKQVEIVSMKRRAYLQHVQELKEKESRYHHWHGYNHNGHSRNDADHSYNNHHAALPTHNPNGTAPYTGRPNYPRPYPPASTENDNPYNPANQINDGTQRKKDKEAKDAKNNAFWAQKKIEDAVDAESIKHKLTLPAEKRRFTAREAAYWRKSRGTKLPKGC
jgi:hypothetical protein